MTLTVRELREVLATYDPDAEVRLGTQQSYPFQNAIDGVTSAAEVAERVAEEHPGDPAADVVTDFEGPVAPETVFILEGGQRGYFNRSAWR